MKFDIMAGDSVIDKDGRIWIWDRVHNVIGYFRDKNYNFYIANQFKEERFDGLAMYLNGHMIYMISQPRAEVLAYDIDKCSFQLFKSGLPKDASQYYSARLNDDKIILIAYELKFGAVLFDMQTGNFEKITLLKTDKYNDRLAVRVVDAKSEMIIIVSDSNEILRFRKKDLSYLNETIPFIHKIGGACVESEDDMWVISEHGDYLVRLFADERIKIEIGEKKERDLFSRLVKHENKIIALPRYATELYVYDISKKQIETIEIPMKLEELREGGSLYWNCFRRNDKVILMPWRYAGIFLELDLNTLYITTNMAKVSAGEYWKYIMPEVIGENQEMGLNFLFDIAGEIKTKNN